MSYFPYDVPTLIELVESRPCLWDKTTNEYKYRNLKKKTMGRSVHVFFANNSRFCLMCNTAKRAIFFLEFILNY